MLFRSDHLSEEVPSTLAVFEKITEFHKAFLAAPEREIKVDFTGKWLEQFWALKTEFLSRDGLDPLKPEVEKKVFYVPILCLFEKNR